MCLVCRWNLRLALSIIAPLSSALKLTGWPVSVYFKAAKNCTIQKASFSASIIAIYSLSVETSATVACCFDWWDTDLYERRKI